MVSQHPAKFGDHTLGSVDIMFSDVEEEDYRCCCFNPPLRFINKGHDLKAHDRSY